jgi:hypothetical protein
MIRAIRAQVGDLCIRNAFPVVVDTYFRFERLCKPDHAMPWPTRERGEFAHGDEDKLRRNALDALTQSGLILDDSLVVGGRIGKRWVRDGESPGVRIIVSSVPDVDGWMP